MERSVVTGMGLETSLGGEVSTVWKALTHGLSGIRPITAFEPTSSLPCKIAGQVWDFDPSEVMSPMEIRRSSRFQQLLLSSATKAYDSSGLGPTDPYRTALVVGTGGGGLPISEELTDFARTTGVTDRFLILKTLPNMAAALVAQRFKIMGPSLTIGTACAASTDAIGLASRLVRAGMVDVALACGVDAFITESSIRGFCSLQVLSTRAVSEASIACRPFDKDRDGMVPAEGAGVLIVESLKHAQSRSAPILGEIVGAASTCDAAHPSAPLRDGSAASMAITVALRDAQMRPYDIDFVSAHGTSTKLNDRAETLALKQALGDRAYNVPITAPKSMIGHTSGACGVIESIITFLSLKNGQITPTINLDEPDPECDLDYVIDEPRSTGARSALKVSFGFGGQNSAVLLRSWEADGE